MSLTGHEQECGVWQECLNPHLYSSKKYVCLNTGSSNIKILILTLEMCVKYLHFIVFVVI